MWKLNSNYAITESLAFGAFGKSPDAKAGKMQPYSAHLIFGFSLCFSKACIYCIQWRSAALLPICKLLGHISLSPRKQLSQRNLQQGSITWLSLSRLPRTKAMISGQHLLSVRGKAMTRGQVHFADPNTLSKGVSTTGSGALLIDPRRCSLKTINPLWNDMSNIPLPRNYTSQFFLNVHKHSERHQNVSGSSGLVEYTYFAHTSFYLCFLCIKMSL